MFTGIVEELGTLVDRIEEGSSLRLQISAGRVWQANPPVESQNLGISQNGLKIDDSISINGVCQTVIAVRPPFFEVIAVQETLQKTTLGSLTVGEHQAKATLNLERAVTLETRLGGHLVQGHVDGLARVADIRDMNGSWEFFFELTRDQGRYVVRQGSISLSGVSLTVASLEDRDAVTIVKVAIIPHTYQMTNFQYLKIGDQVNVELDIIAKMVERMTQAYQR